jgi:hypothetical protein
MTTSILPAADGTPTPSPQPDQQVIHGLCALCYPFGKVVPGQVVVAICGDVDTFDLWSPPGDGPSDCVVCVDIVRNDLPARSCDHWGQR